jgi:glycosyltransferase involved in cell wall biosynthesis
MPVYNSARFLAEAIESILAQTIRDFELLAVYDDSTDGSRAVLERFERLDRRVSVIQGKNKGLIAALNQGIDAAKGMYIARMDADDISLPHRFEKQLQMMESESADICGGHFFMIDQSGHFLDAFIVPIAPESILIALALSVSFAHGSVMLRRGFLEEHGIQYGTGEHKAAEDYALWTRLHGLGAKFRNVDDWIFSYRHHDVSASQRGWNRVERDRRRISLQFIRDHRDKLTRALESLRGKEVSSREQESMAQMGFILALRFFRPNVLPALRTLRTRVLILGFYRAARDVLFCRA